MVFKFRFIALILRAENAQKTAYSLPIEARKVREESLTSKHL